VCSSCGVAFIEGESHVCKPRPASVRRAIGCLLALVLGFLLQFPLVFLGERTHSRFFNGWSYWHLTFALVWPVLTLLVFAVLMRFRKKLK
jgi:hypothetical protein